MANRRGTLLPFWLAGACAVAVGAACSEDQNLVSGGGGAGGGSVSQGGSTATLTGGGGSVQCIGDLESISLEPADSTVTLDGGPIAPIEFVATGTFKDGSTEVIPGNALEWTATRVDDTDPGTIEDGTYAPNPSAGGLVEITASDGCVEASTTIKLFLDVEIGDPTNPDDWNAAPVTTGDVPLIVYPSDETRFPRNLYRTIFQWRSQGYSEFRLVYEGPNSTVTVYTDGAHGLCADANPAAGCWEVNEVAWSYIAGSNAGATASWVVDALDHTTDPPTIRRSQPIDIGFSLQDVEGAIFYWSTTSAGIRRGRISQQHPEDYIVGKPEATTYGTNEVRCVACHVVSRDGMYLAAPVEASEGKSLWITEVTPDAPPNPLVTDIPETEGHGFATISPDDERVVAAFRGRMTLHDRASGNKIGDIDLGALDGTQPDWSPAGDELVFATKEGDAPGGASLAKIPWDGSNFGSPEILLAPPGDRTNIFPMFSPEGDWIAFSQGKGGHGDNQAQLFVVDADANEEPVELVNANRVTSNTMTTGQYQNSQPTWAPPGDLHWVAFNTKREYGVIQEAGRQQIWVAAVDPSKLGTGEDPSYPAFRVPFQGLAEDNHRAYWTLDVGDGGGGEGGAGGGGEGGSGPGCSEILNLGDMCDPLEDCCESGTHCDTLDSGVTYECLADIPT
ncbi:MAG: hypothetical protein HOW73_43775 [Polyangiaceae bacterium]|nr:hypothetical protein [Polyangiaceae bacterium]